MWKFRYPLCRQKEHAFAGGNQASIPKGRGDAGWPATRHRCLSHSQISRAYLATPKRRGTTGAEIIVDFLIWQNQQEHLPHGHRLCTFIAVERGGPQVLELAHARSVGDWRRTTEKFPPIGKLRQMSPQEAPPRSYEEPPMESSKHQYRDASPRKSGSTSAWTRNHRCPSDGG